MKLILQKTDKNTISDYFIKGDYPSICIITIDDILSSDERILTKFRGYTFDLILVPKRGKDLLKDSKLREVLFPQLITDGCIEYY